ncbi:SDR family NAD(P)-dependent oxidoreductase [Halomarina litorea]|uniref:SDR family NAD(P)-dependent oxidoreductase n=1 Tax=Halomarina litorea TaxID=2961595 RepID=UPI0020C32429|nr:SDR family NAD(P)-dependent oxidoreductase [Halomarina sp. BCD28]
MTRTAVIAGVGPGLGESLARRFVEEGCRVGLFARSADYLEDLADDLGADALAVPTDLTDPAEVRRGFEAVRDAFGPVDVLVNHASGAPWKGTMEVSPEAFEDALRVGPMGALYCSQEAVRDMLDNYAEETSASDQNAGRSGSEGGTVVFTGATTSVRGRGGAVAFSAAKFACRGMAESMARELGPEGIHVAHVVIDGQILTPSARESMGDREADAYLDPDEVARQYWNLVEQDRTAWTLELDLRPSVEEF